MRFQQGHAEVQAEGFSQSANFTIAASGKAFKGLIDGLYSRKVEAIIRELATNAFDAHKAAGSIAPFDIQLPSLLRPTFAIRDYGTGMSHELVMERYTTLFDSTKDGLNEADIGVSPDEQVGCLGLGSKVFFAYTDSCVITVWIDGMVRHYTVYMGANGVPQLALASEEPSDEPVGVKVEFAVKPKDFDEFAKAAIRVFKGFPVLPTGLPVVTREALAVEPVEMGAIWKTYPADYLPGGGFWARQGCVLYPIDLDQIDDRAVLVEDDDYDGEGEAPMVVALSDNFARFSGVKLTTIIDFPIGSIDFDLSRERLAYNDRTVLALRKRWATFTDDLDGILETTFAEKKTGWERAVTACDDLFSNLGPLFAGTRIKREADHVREHLNDLFPRQRSYFSTLRHMFTKAIKYDVEKPFDVLTAFGSNHDNMNKDVSPADVVIVYEDVKRKGKNRIIHQHLQNADKTYAFVIAPRGLTVKRYKLLGCPKIVRLSEMEGLPVEEKSSGAREWYGGGVFDRIKIRNPGHGDYSAPAKDADLSKYVWAFMHRGRQVGRNFEEIYNGTYQISLLNNLFEMVGAPAIGFINLRLNDKQGRWDDLPRYEDTLVSLTERFTKKQVGDFIRVWNHEQFATTNFYYAYNRLSEAERRIPDDLTRLARRYGLKKHTHGIWGEVCTHSVFETIRNELFRRAVDYGMEVLPPKASKHRYLSKKWVKAVELLSHTSKPHLRTLIRKDAQC